jgi:hypothetical protein
VAKLWSNKLFPVAIDLHLRRVGRPAKKPFFSFRVTGWVAIAWQLPQQFTVDRLDFFNLNEIVS